MRRLWLVPLVLVLGAWGPCVPVTGGDDVAGMSTAGLAAMVAGEDWHYVGETDEPAFNSTWVNFIGRTKMAFRIRETGVVDLQGFADHAGNGNALAIFTLPVGYRPLNGSRLMAICDTGPCMIAISTFGEVIPLTYGGTLGEVWISGQFFLDGPVAA